MLPLTGDKHKLKRLADLCRGFLFTGGTGRNAADIRRDAQGRVRRMCTRA
ncbi:MAG: hypothetical protein ACI3VB_03665 [Oscillospiraceae bacterium]